MLELREAAEALAGARLIGDGATRFAGVSTDTRGIAPGELFVALRGERFDAHAFVARARAAGAAGGCAAGCAGSMGEDGVLVRSHEGPAVAGATAAGAGAAPAAACGSSPRGGGFAASHAGPATAAAATRSRRILELLCRSTCGQG